LAQRNQQEDCAVAKPEQMILSQRYKRPVLVGSGFTILVLSFFWFIGVFGGNIREVVPGRFYRSAQIGGPLLESVIQKYGIKSVLNLRGSSPGEDYYESELATCAAKGVEHRDIGISAYRLPPPKELKEIIDGLENLPKPILVHCRGGADRSGLVSTLYMNLYEHVPLERAEHEQLTWRYGHMSFASAGAMDRFFDLYRSTSKGEDIRIWSLNSYPALYKAEQDRGAKDVLPPKGRE
jgi:protein tyrosine/serine phosphatase